VPGLKVVAPWNVEDTRGLLKASIRDNDPVVFLENEMMYGVSFDTPDHVFDKDFVLPLNKGKIEKEGTDVTITAFSKMVGFSLEAAAILQKEHGINAEVINLRCIRPLDRNLIVQSVKKTNRIVSVEEGWPQCGIGAEISALMMETEAFDYLDAPLERVAGADIPMPYAISIERLAVPQVENIVSGVLKACYRKNK
jgi:pyruvate dehydrogenase E1 component beta subunit